MPEKGKVYLIGCGPGRFDFLTLRALQVLPQCQVAVYDHLIPIEIFHYLPRDCELINVSKLAGAHTRPQEEINQILIEKASEGLTVGRLKGGDPFIFGRGGEEALALSKAGIQYEIIPGLTAGIACADWAGIPVTHRKTSVALHLITAHEAQDKQESQVRWDLLARDVNGTIIGYMGVKTLPTVTQRLIQEGLDPETPASLIHMGAQPEQRILTTTLKNLSSAAIENNITPPAIFIIGKTVNLINNLKWLPVLPLHHTRIIITRHKEGIEPLAQSLRLLGAQVIPCPVINIQYLQEIPEKVDLNNISEYDWIIFTSSHGIKSFFQILRSIDLDVRKLYGVKLAVIGQSSAEALRQYGLQPDLIPSIYNSRTLLAEMTMALADYKARILRVRGNLAPDTLEVGLREKGHQVTRCTTYITSPDSPPKPIQQFIKDSRDHCITFTSSSTFNNFCEVFGAEISVILKRARIYSIGPETTKIIEAAGYKVYHEANPHTTRALLEAIITRESAQED